MTAAPATADRFTYDHYELDTATGTLRCHYQLGDRRFSEEFGLGPDGDWRSPKVEAAARLVFLLAGVSYYKTAAPPVVDLGATAISDAERDLLLLFYREGLAEFAYRNGLDLTTLQISAAGTAPAPAPLGPPPGDRPLVPFGGGIDSIVVTEAVRERHPEATLFVLGHAGNRFEAIDRAADVTGLPCLRADRRLDPQVLRSAELGFLNGHVPVTGIVSAVAVLAALVHGHDAVVMSNERSADVGTTLDGGRSVNHQLSKSLRFESAFRRALTATLGGSPSYFSLLRPYSELWVARRFAALDQYHRVFRSCNRAFTVDPARRLDHWCGTCDKCCFIDLVLSPFLPAAVLGAIFPGAEPLADETLAGQFRVLLGQGGAKPFECVGEVDECRAAARLAAARPDRRDDRLLQQLVAELPAEVADPRAATEPLLGAVGDHYIPDAYSPEHLLV